VLDSPLLNFGGLGAYVFPWVKDIGITRTGNVKETMNTRCQEITRTGSVKDEENS
jgi:hypothetical protein